MQLLKVPLTFIDMTKSISLTGVTVLKENAFKARHGGSKQIVQRPVEGLILSKNDIWEKERKKLLKPVRKKKKKPEVQKIKRIKKSTGYKVNKKEVGHRIRNMVNQMQGEKKLFFWTISFPAKTPDNVVYLCFNRWLTRCRRDLNLRSYLWVAERQKIGTVHFHIAIHQRLCVKKANRFMRAAIFTSIDNKEIVYSREAAKNYNGVDIAKDRKTKKVTNFAQKNKSKSLVNYIIKYISKNEGTFEHLAYHCSRDYSNLIICFRFTDSDWERSIIKNSINEVDIFENEWCIFYKWKDKVPLQVSDYLAHVNRIVISLINTK